MRHQIFIHFNTRGASDLLLYSQVTEHIAPVQEKKTLKMENQFENAILSK